MLAVLIIIGVMGIGLPVALWLIARWRKSLPEKPYVFGEVNKWLLSEYGLGARDRSAVQGAVLGRFAAVTVLDQAPRKPAPSLRPELLEAARGLATRITADRFRKLRLARQMGWVQMAGGAAAVVYGVGVLAAGWATSRFLGVYTLVEAGLFIPAGSYNALIIPRRLRRGAQDYLATAAPRSPGSPSAPPGQPGRHDGN
ncbi:MAG: hypothetical protein M3Z75_07090 [Actinomycetota bacterium]|nr:hypothetical protein [Actinomycetota bacterium]